jgi:hypothetical protein
MLKKQRRSKERDGREKVILLAFSNSGNWKKDRHIPHENCHFLLNANFLVREIDKPT